MQAAKSDIIARLRQQLHPLQGVKTTLNGIEVATASGPQKIAFPNDLLSYGAVHEFVCNGSAETTATSGFIAALLATLMKNGGVAIWISAKRNLFPTGLVNFGILPENIIFLDLQKTKDMLWALEEALKCSSIAAVIGEIPELSFTSARRLQLAVEQSGTMGFILRNNPRNLTTTGCVTRWKISSLPSNLENGMPGVGFPRWNASLLKTRNGKPANWEVEWAAGKFRTLSSINTAVIKTLKKAG
ncbi:MAG: Error-prone repair protein ImuA [Bacteroidota bacterium]